MVPEYSEYKDKNPDASNVPEESDIDPEASDEDKLLMRTLGIKKGKCPEDAKGLYHQLMKMAYIPRTIEKIFHCPNDDLIYLFYTTCVSQSVGKRKWNQFSKMKPLSAFVSPADEAFAMVVIENNVAKWMNEIRFGKQKQHNYQFKTMYTDGAGGRQWTSEGITRFINLVKLCKQFRVSEQEKAKYQEIENMIIRRERSTSHSSNNNELGEFNSSDTDDDTENVAEMEAELVAMANGEI